MNYRRTYIQNSKIFITMVTSKRRKILLKNIDILRSAFQKTKEKIQLNIDAIVILPNHLHMIISPKEINKYPEIIKRIKTHFSKETDETKIENYKLTKSRKNKNEKDIWQRRYFEHTILDEKDLMRHIDYIHYNPVKHNLVQAPKDWKYSSFKKFVKKGYYDKNWYNAEDECKIERMELE